MKIYPRTAEKKEVRATEGLSRIERITRIIAMCIAFASVFFFFLKLLFF